MATESIWVASPPAGELFFVEILMRPGRVFTLDSGVLQCRGDEKSVTLGTLLGFSSELQALKEALGPARILPLGGK